MTENPKNNEIFKIIVLLSILVLIAESTQAQDLTVSIHLRGVYASKISLISLSASNTFKTITTLDSVKNEDTISLMVSRNSLPGEFLLRFDYKQDSSSTSYPSEKRIIIGKQDLQLWVHPVYCNDSDSTWFQENEKENTTYHLFQKENTARLQKVGLLQNFLLNYDNINSTFYQEGIIEYEKRRHDYNQWIDDQYEKYRKLFVSNLFIFNYIPHIDWKGSEADRKQNLMDNYFEGMDFQEPLILKTTRMKEWMDGYVNLYGELATCIPLRDSLFTFAGRRAIEKARNGHPEIYGWMVDYFFNGYESFNIEQGIKMLDPFLNDPDCLTSKRLEIQKRLKGMETLLPGTAAPNINMKDTDNLSFELYNYLPDKNYLLLLFWSADCGHCVEKINSLYPKSQYKEAQKKLDIIAISLDETDTEIQSWENKIIELKGWRHLRAEEGISSKVANDYFILSVPVMILLNAETKEIIALPESVDQLDEFLKP